MELLLLNNEEKERYREELLAMLQGADGDFVPPLSKRFSPKQTAFGAERTGASSDGVRAYFEDMYKEQMLAAVEDGHLLGFVTFMRDLDHPCFGGDAKPNLYICTLLVKPEARGRRLTQTMYRYLFSELFADCKLFTRTWSTNAAHIAILQKFGFREIHRIPNDRGNGIDTVYFGRAAARALALPDA